MTDVSCLVDAARPEIQPYLRIPSATGCVVQHGAGAALGLFQMAFHKNNAPESVARIEALPMPKDYIIKKSGKTDHFHVVTAAVHIRLAQNAVVPKAKDRQSGIAEEKQKEQNGLHCCADHGVKRGNRRHKEEQPAE